ncbi:MAG: hypothetical protein ABSG03_08020 [Bryobacteraceae bacterium]
MPNEFAEVIWHGGDIVTYENSSVFPGDSQDGLIAETFKGNLLRALEVQTRVAEDYA